MEPGRAQSMEPGRARSKCGQFAGCWLRLESAFDVLLKGCLSEPWGVTKTLTETMPGDQGENSHYPLALVRC